MITAVLIAHTESRYGSEGVKFSLIGVTTVALVFTLLELMMWLYTAAETGCMLSQWFLNDTGSVTSAIIQEIFYICGFFQRAAEMHWSTAGTLKLLKVFFHSLYDPFIHCSHTTLTLPKPKKKNWGVQFVTNSKMYSSGIWCNIWTFISPPIGMSGQPAEWDAQQGGEKRGRTVSSSHTSLSNQSQIIWQLMLIQAAKTQFQEQYTADNPGFHSTGWRA